MTTTKLIAAVASIITAAVLAGWGTHSTPASAAPRPCRISATTWLPAGDASRQYIPQLHRTQEFVCTDGTWVHVTGYSSTR